MSDVTRILSAIEQGDREASEELLPLVYSELRKLAARRMENESPDHTLQATALVHEAYVRLVDTNKVRGWESRWQFFAAAAEAMRRILITHARRNKSQKRGGDYRRIDIEMDDLADDVHSDKFLALDEALERFAEVDAVKAELVKLRYFAGLTLHDAAVTLGISPATADRYWTYARAWLQRELSEPGEWATG